MERVSSGCTLPTRMALVILVLFSLSSRCEQDTFRAPAEAKFESGVSGDAFTELKRYEDIDYDSFVSLMGRRSAAQPNRPMDHILSALLGQRTNAEEAADSRLINRGLVKARTYLFSNRNGLSWCQGGFTGDAKPSHLQEAAILTLCVEDTINNSSSHGNNEFAAAI